MFRDITPKIRTDLAAAFPTVRREMWGRSSVTNRADPVVLDIDASLAKIHSENKAGTAPTYKGGFRFHPSFCFADATDGTLAALLQPGNAAANSRCRSPRGADTAIAQCFDASNIPRDTFVGGTGAPPAPPVPEALVRSGVSRGAQARAVMCS